MDQPPLTEPKLDERAEHLCAGPFVVVAEALRARVDPIIHRWRIASLRAMPSLNQLPIAEFNNSMAMILEAMAHVMESDDPVHVRNVIEKSPVHGFNRFLQHISIESLLAEERILRTAIIVELRGEMGRPLADDEAAALHEVIDLLVAHSVLALIRSRSRDYDELMRQRFDGSRRLSDLGTLVAGVAHDAANLLLPLRMSVDRLRQSGLSGQALVDVDRIDQVFHHFQNTIVNLRWLSVDPSQRTVAGQSLDLGAFAEEFQQFQRSMLPGTISLEFRVPASLPPVRITQAALSQVLFNLIRNAHQAIRQTQERGGITVRAREQAGGTVDLTIEDDGPGMPPDVLQRCFETFFTTQPQGSGSGLGLALVQALVNAAGGTVAVHSPPPGSTRGTQFVLSLAIATEQSPQA